MSDLATKVSIEPPNPARRRWSTSLAPVVIVLVGVAAYHNSLGGPFIFDDIGSITENRTIRRLWPIRPLFSPPAKGLAVQSRPVVNVSLAINYAIGGLDVRGYHVFNLVAHILAALTLFGVIRRTLGLAAVPEYVAGASLPLALAAALIWTVHPLATEAVTYVIQRTESMTGLFYLLVLYCVIRGAAASRHGLWYLAAIVACALGVGCKEVAATAPLIVLVYDRVFLARSFKEAFARRWRLYVGLAATWLLLAALVMPVMSMAGTRGGFGGMTYWKVLRYYAFTQSIMIVRYLRLCFWPHPLILDYGPEPTGRAAVLSVPHAIVMVALLGGTIWALRRRCWLGFLGVWFFAILAPSSSFVPLLIQPAAEKRMYLPLAAVVAVVVILGYVLGRDLLGRLVAAGHLRRALGRVAAVGLVAAVALILGFLTVRRNSDYRSELAIWDDTVNKQANNWRGWNGRGLAYGQLGDYDQAIADFSRAIELKPDIAKPYNNRALVYEKKGRHDREMHDLNRAIEVDPDYAVAYNNRAMAYRKRGLHDKEMQDLNKAIELKGDYAIAYQNRAAAYAIRGDYEKARVDLRKVQTLGRRPDPRLIELLRRASRRK